MKDLSAVRQRRAKIAAAMVELYHLSESQADYAAGWLIRWGVRANQVSAAQPSIEARRLMRKAVLWARADELEKEQS